MKKIILASMLVLSLFLVSCAEEFPPEPSPPGAIPTEGSGAIAGQAVAFEGYADPEGFFTITPTAFDWAHRAVADVLNVLVQNDQLVYKTGYITQRGQSWTSFDYDGEQVGSSNWLRGRAAKTNTVSLDNSGEGSGNYVVAYACTKRLGSWDCHGDQWMLQSFSITVGCETDSDCLEGQFCDAGECIGLPSAPPAPAPISG